MSEIELKKNNVLKELQGLCAHCSNGVDHACPIEDIVQKVKAVSGVPLIVNNEFKGVLWSRVQSA